MQVRKEPFEGWQVTLCVADRPTNEHICVPPVVKGYARKVKTTRYAGGCLFKIDIEVFIFKERVVEKVGNGYL